MNSWDRYVRSPPLVLRLVVPVAAVLASSSLFLNWPAVAAAVLSVILIAGAVSYACAPEKVSAWSQRHPAADVFLPISVAAMLGAATFTEFPVWLSVVVAAMIGTIATAVRAFTEGQSVFVVHSRPRLRAALVASAVSATTMWIAAISQGWSWLLIPAGVLFATLLVAIFAPSHESDG
ncbi:hypothetical protein ACFWNH_31025 [Rhodococcus qingshengii]|uniref:hypothetical protein n=1 Tax=Rhodococcus qingshengii TaxID=334542 RepID=UPI00364E1A99